MDRLLQIQELVNWINKNGRCVEGLTQYDRNRNGVAMSLTANKITHQLGGWHATPAENVSILALTDLLYNVEGATDRSVIMSIDHYLPGAQMVPVDKRSISPTTVDQLEFVLTLHALAFSKNWDAKFNARKESREILHDAAKYAAKTLVQTPYQQIVPEHNVHMIRRCLMWATGKERDFTIFAGKMDKDSFLIDGDLPAQGLPWKIIEKLGSKFIFKTPAERIENSTWIDEQLPLIHLVSKPHTEPHVAWLEAIRKYGEQNMKNIFQNWLNRRMILLDNTLWVTGELAAMTHSRAIVLTGTTNEEYPIPQFVNNRTETSGMFQFSMANALSAHWHNHKFVR